MSIGLKFLFLADPRDAGYRDLCQEHQEVAEHHRNVRESYRIRSQQEAADRERVRLTDAGGRAADVLTSQLSRLDLVSRQLSQQQSAVMRRSGASASSATSSSSGGTRAAALPAGGVQQQPAQLASQVSFWSLQTRM